MIHRRTTVVVPAPYALALHTPQALGWTAFTLFACCAVLPGAALSTRTAAFAPQTAMIASAGGSPGPLAISNETFHFGTQLVGFPQTKTVAVVTNTTKQTVPLQFRLTGDPGYSQVTGNGNSCGSSLAGRASCNVDVTYTPRTPSVPKMQAATLLVGSIGGPKFSFFEVALNGISGVLPAGVVSSTGNPMVARYALTLPFAGTWKVTFGPTTGYGFDTSVVASATPGAATSVYVAGMYANTTYHMRASVTLANGATATDIDHTFTTGPLPPGLVPQMITTTTPGMTPQPGVELITTISGSTRNTAYATDLAGTPIWTYMIPESAPSLLPYPVKLLPNGHLLMLLALNSGVVNPNPSIPNVIREIDLAGNTVRELPMAVLNTRMQAAGYNLTLELFSHDILLLPNGHLLVIANTVKPIADFENSSGVTNVLGDVVIDLDENMQPVWVWNAFDHLDVHRHPMGFPDWTHANSLEYSADDGNFLFSMRHQNWVIKVNYNNGQGDGSILWRLGPQGDFALKGGTDPQDWFYAQHFPTFFSTNTTGVFTLGLMDNGDDRAFSDGGNCLTNAGLCYTTIPVMRVDEVLKTATLIWRQVLPNSVYSAFAGDTLLLPNGDIEYNLAGNGANSRVFEVTRDASQTTVWNMYLPGTNTYRAFRIPSLYPGVQW